jgi:hypothetical protein
MMRWISQFRPPDVSFAFVILPMFGLAYLFKSDNSIVSVAIVVAVVTVIGSIITATISRRKDGGSTSNYPNPTSPPTRQEKPAGEQHKAAKSNGHAAAQQSEPAAYHQQANYESARDSGEGQSTLGGRITSGWDIAGRDRLRPTEASAVSQGRVVNLFFWGPEGIVANEQSLIANKEYDLRLHIGPFDPDSVVQNPQKFPDEALNPFMRAEGLPIRVVISSRHFRISKNEQVLRLPPTGRSSDVSFQVRAPEVVGTAQLRAVLYFQGNALQSLLVTAQITDSVGPPFDRSITAEVEYCLCGSLESPERYPARTLNILTNESSDGTHTFSVLGTKIFENFVFTELEMEASLKEARQTLLEICAKLDKNGDPQSYLYDSKTNAGSSAQIVSDLKKLAAVGSGLYVNFVTRKDQEFEEKLEEALATHASIQIASVRSAKYVFPWAMVYDKPLVVDRGNTICQTFLSALKETKALIDSRSPGALPFLQTAQCFAIGCPHKEDTNVICPSAFWGFKHTLEQPPSVLQGDEESSKRDVEIELIVNGNARMMMGVSLQLASPDLHYTELSKLGRYAVTIKKNKTEILSAMGGAPSPDLIYFYCHGGKLQGKGFLGIGQGERLIPGDLFAKKFRWQKSHPLVFINGCRTAELAPGDLLNFVNMFSWCQASGVIGTEISIPEPLAQEFAASLFRSLAVDGTTVGEAIHDQRLLLLGKYNLMGLAYTPYCHASLRFKFREDLVTSPS